jgi:hypothetical protein
MACRDAKQVKNSFFLIPFGNKFLADTFIPLRQEFLTGKRLPPDTIPFRLNS